MTVCGLIGPSSGCSKPRESFSRHSLICSHQSFNASASGEPSRRAISSSSCLSTSPTSPTIGRCAWIFFEMDEGSTSMWITCASGAKASSLPVTRSSKRAPTAISRSQWETAIFASKVPCIPSMPTKCSSSCGMPPSPIRVLVTGAFSVWESSLNRDALPIEFMMPPPV